MLTFARPLRNSSYDPEAKFKSKVITGYNTDVEFGGVVYHVQTEDKGLRTPIILSLVYIGGAILASKRAPYDDLVARGFDEQILVERLQRQHKLICAAVHAGRIEDLKRMSERDAASSRSAARARTVRRARAARVRAACPTAAWTTPRSGPPRSDSNQAALKPSPPDGDRETLP